MSIKVLAIDPGNIESGWVVLDAATKRPLLFDKTPNDELRAMLLTRGLADDIDHIAVEMIASYGMAVGAEVFDTCVWIGRFTEMLGADRVRPIKRAVVKTYHCHSNRAKDSNVRQALVDRFAPGEANFGKGTKASPGFFYGFRSDVWQAYALGVYLADQVAPPLD